MYSKKGIRSTSRSVDDSSNYDYTSVSTRRSSSAVSQKSGDYNVLYRSIQQQRLLVRKARSDLASILHRLGEHHVRNKEYDDAIGTFTEALQEKRSALGLTSHTSENHMLQGGSVPYASQYGDLNDELIKKGLDDTMSILSNMGNVHSLRGEHSDAMRCYNEIMSIRASRSNMFATALDVASTSCSGSSFSGIGGWVEEDASTILTDLNEDVKALDDLFRSISFRNGELRGVGGDNESILSSGASSKLSKQSPTKATSLSSPKSKNEHPSKYGLTITRQECRDDHDYARSIATQFSSALDFSACEVKEALGAYRSVLDAYKGHNLELYEQSYDDLSQQASTLNQTDNCHQNGQKHVSSFRDQSLRLVLEIYDKVLTTQRDIASSWPMPKADSDSTSTNKSKAQQVIVSLASTLITVGSIHYKLGNVDQELQLYNEALSTYTDALGENHPYVAGTRKNIGMVLAERSDFDEAMEEFDKARKIYSKINEGSDLCRDVASALSCMGNVQNRQGELDIALSFYSKALHIFRSVAERDGWTSTAYGDVTSTLKIIGMVYAKRADLDSAMNCFQEAMELLRSPECETEGKNGVGVASILTRIGGIFYRKSQYDEAMSHYQEAYDVATKALGTATHPDIAGILHYMGGVYQKRCQYTEAMTCYRNCVKVYHATLGPDNPAVATTLVCIGSIHYKKKNLDNAMVFYKEAYRLYENAYGPHHPDVAPTLKSIAMLHAKKGNYEDAMDLFMEVLRMKCVVLGSCHPDVANAYKSIGNVHLKQGEYADAERQYRHALGIYRQTHGDDHPETQATRSNIDRIREKMGKARLGSRDRRESRSSSRNYKNIRGLARSLTSQFNSYKTNEAAYFLNCR